MPGRVNLMALRAKIRPERAYIRLRWPVRGTDGRMGEHLEIHLWAAAQKGDRRINGQMNGWIKRGSMLL